MDSGALCQKIETSLIALINEAAKGKTLKINVYTGWGCRLKLTFPSLFVPPLFGNSSSNPPFQSKPLVQWDTPDPG